tara:strand:+ start:1898 stop:2155 length:258 start_codon:yes stop_codon:yes gene_type:complete
MSKTITVEKHKKINEMETQIEENRIALLQYESLRKNFSIMIDKVLGEDYYNMAMDVYDSDRICCEDITIKANETIVQKIKYFIFS